MFDFDIQDGVLVWYKGEAETVEIPREVTRIGVGAFRDSEVVQVMLHDGITRIHREAFLRCYRLREIDIPDSVTRIDGYAFCHCAAMESVRLPSKLDAIRDGTFGDCASLQSIDIPSGVKFIGSVAFSGCNTLSTVTLPDGIEEIKDLAFSGCTELRLEALPSRLRHLGGMVFDGCNHITSLRLGPEIQEMRVLALPDSIQQVYIPAERLGDYRRMLIEGEQCALGFSDRCALIVEPVDQSIQSKD